MAVSGFSVPNPPNDPHHLSSMTVTALSEVRYLATSPEADGPDGTKGPKPVDRPIEKMDC